MVKFVFFILCRHSSQGEDDLGGAVEKSKGKWQRCKRGLREKGAVGK